METNRSDNEIMLSVRNGDIDILGVLFDRYHVQLYNFFRMLAVDPQTSGHLVQDVFLRIIETRRSFDGKTRFSAWLIDIAYNRFCSHAGRNRAAVAEETAPDGIHELPRQAGPALPAEEPALLRKAMRGIAGEDRIILVLSAYHNLTYREIADILECSAGTVKTRAFRSVRELRRIYTRLTAETVQPK